MVRVWFSGKLLSPLMKFGLSTHLEIKWQPYFGGWAFNYLPEEAPGIVQYPPSRFEVTHFETARVAAIPEVDIL